MNVNEMNADELLKLHSELQSTMSQVSERLRTLEEPTNCWSVTVSRELHVQETAMFVVRAATMNKAAQVAEAVAEDEDCELIWHRDYSMVDYDHPPTVDSIEPSNDLPDYCFDDQGDLLLIGNDGSAERKRREAHDEVPPTDGSQISSNYPETKP